jgi:hypothetical protein
MISMGITGAFEDSRELESYNSLLKELKRSFETKKLYQKENSHLCCNPIQTSLFSYNFEFHDRNIEFLLH